MTRQEKQELVKILKIGLKEYDNGKDEYFWGLCHLFKYLYPHKLSLYQSVLISQYLIKCTFSRKLIISDYWWLNFEKQPRIAWLKSTIKRLEKQLNETT